MLRLPLVLHQELKHYVVDHHGKSLNDVIVEAIEKWWEAMPERTRYAALVTAASKKRGAP